MKLIADENIPKYVVDKLAEQGFEIVSIREILPGAKDKEVISFVEKKKGILLTFDKDFGELMYKERKAVKGIILLRFFPISPEVILKRLKNLFSKYPGLEFENNFIVVDEDKIRVRKIF